MPLRISLVALTLVLAVVGLAVSGVSVTSAMRQDLQSRTDSGLLGAVDSWAKPRERPARGEPGTPPGPRRPPSPYFVQARMDNGETLSSNDFGDQPDISGLAEGNVGPVTVGSRDGSGPQWRLVQRVNAHGQVIVATPLTDVNATISRLIWLQLGVGALVVLVLGVLSYLLVRSSLRPLRRVEHTAHAIAAGDLTRRVPPGAPGTEVGGLSESLNTMLGQIQHAFAATAASETQARSSEERMRRFVADASHELRTPLTSIKGYAELYRQGGVSDTSDAMRRIDDEAGRMALLVEDLLLLARMDAQRPLQQVPVDMLELAADAMAAAHAAAPDRDLRLDVAPGDEPPMVSGDRDRLVQVVRNLLANAVAHTPAQASVTVRVGADGDEVVLSVADSGPGLDEQERAHVFERFYRGDASRRRGDDGGGNGLGLSIVAALVAAHDGRVGVESVPGDGATFWVRLPRLRA